MSEELIKEHSLEEQFEQIIATDNKLAISEFLNDQNISDVANLIYGYKEHEAMIVAEQKRIITELPPFKTAELLNELPADDRTSFLEELPSNVVRELNKLLEPQERKVTLSLLGYPENSVGRLMTPDYVYVYPQNTVTEV